VGSGICLPFQAFLSFLPSLADHEIHSLEWKLIRKGIRVQYASQAVLYDERPVDLEAICERKCRWKAHQFNYLLNCLAIRRRSLKNVNKGAWIHLMQMISPPAALTPLTFLLFALISFLQSSFIPPAAWLILWLVCLLSIIPAVPRKFYRKKLFTEMVRVPVRTLYLWACLYRWVMNEEKPGHEPLVRQVPIIYPA
jgi:hypothetical protein